MSCKVCSLQPSVPRLSTYGELSQGAPSLSDVSTGQHCFRTLVENMKLMVAILRIVWGPALCILTLGAGLASVPHAGSINVWIGLVVWLTVVTGIGEVLQNKYRQN